MMSKRYSLRQRIVMAARDYNRRLTALAQCSVQCPGCGSTNVTGGGDEPYACGNCGSIWQ